MCMSCFILASPVDIDLLNVAGKDFVIKSAANLTRFTGNLSKPDDFFR